VSLAILFASSSSAGPAPDLGFVVMVVVFLGLPFAVMGLGAVWSALMGHLHGNEADRQAGQAGQ
jgi:hypothetical protein